MTVYFHTFGCKVNQYETDCIAAVMLQRGHTRVYDQRSADIVIINTCTVTESADSKLMQLLRRIKRENPLAVTVVCGCYPQAHKDLSLIKEADIIAGENNKTLIPSLIDNYISDRQKLVSILPHKKGESIESMSLPERKDKTRAIIKIQDGCDRFCSYCIIPYARGRSRSKPLSDIENEAYYLGLAGHKEIVLVGINLSCYGADLSESSYADGLPDANHTPDLCDAVCAAAKSSADRIRLGSIEPEMLTPELIKRLSKEDKLCPHFHLSLQSGCDKTLQEMRRRYNTADYELLVKTLRESFDGCSITTDIMTGFPGETEEDFLQSLSFVKKVGFSSAHVFPYSEREGTLAAKRSDQVPKSMRLKRAKIMTAAVKESEREFLQSLVGKTVSVLFEREQNDDWHQGHTSSYTLVKVKRTHLSLWREILNVRITAAEDGYCVGEIVD